MTEIMNFIRDFVMEFIIDNGVYMYLLIFVLKTLPVLNPRFTVTRAR